MYVKVHCGNNYKCRARKNSKTTLYVVNSTQRNQPLEKDCMNPQHLPHGRVLYVFEGCMTFDLHQVKVLQEATDVVFF